MFSCVFEGEGDGESLLGVPSYFKGSEESCFLSDLCRGWDSLSHRSCNFDPAHSWWCSVRSTNWSCGTSESSWTSSWLWSPMSPAFVGKCIARIMDDKDVVFSELGPPTVSLDPKKPNQVFSSPFSGGLGWGLPATLGAALANPNRLNIACVGEGSYIFANPVACHQIAEALELPILIIIMNNTILSIRIHLYHDASLNSPTVFRLCHRSVTHALLLSKFQLCLPGIMH